MLIEKDEKLHQKAQALQETLEKREQQAVKKGSRSGFQLGKQIVANQIYRKRYELEQQDTSFKTASKTAAAVLQVHHEVKKWQHDSVKKYRFKHIECLERKTLYKGTKNNPLSEDEVNELRNELRSTNREKTPIRSFADVRIRYHQTLMPSRKVKQKVKYEDKATGEIKTQRLVFKTDDNPALHIKSLPLRITSAGASALKFKAEQDIMYNEDGNSAAQASAKSLKFGERTVRSAAHSHNVKKYDHRKKSHQLQKKKMQKLARNQSYKIAYKNPIKRAAAKGKDSLKRAGGAVMHFAAPILFALAAVLLLFLGAAALLSLLVGGTTTSTVAASLAQYVYTGTADDYTQAVYYWGVCADDFMRTFKHIPDVVENDEWNCRYYPEIKLDVVDQYRLAAVLSCFFKSDDYDDISKLQDFIRDLFNAQYYMAYDVQNETRIEEVTEKIPVSDGEIKEPYPDEWVSVETIEDDDGTEYYLITKNEQKVYKILHFEMYTNGSFDDIVRKTCEAAGDDYIDRYETYMQSYGLISKLQYPLSSEYPTYNSWFDKVAAAPGNIVTYEYSSSVQNPMLVLNSNSGDNVYNMADGIVTAVSDSSVTVKTNSGLYIKIDGLTNVAAVQGQQAARGCDLGNSTGQLKVLVYNEEGEFLNPVFLIDNGFVADFLNTQ